MSSHQHRRWNKSTMKEEMREGPTKSNSRSSGRPVSGPASRNFSNSRHSTGSTPNTPAPNVQKSSDGHSGYQAPLNHPRKFHPQSNRPNDRQSSQSNMVPSGPANPNFIKLPNRPQSQQPLNSSDSAALSNQRRQHRSGQQFTRHRSPFPASNRTKTTSESTLKNGPSLNQPPSAKEHAQWNGKRKQFFDEADSGSPHDKRQRWGLNPKEINTGQNAQSHSMETGAAPGSAFRASRQVGPLPSSSAASHNQGSPRKGSAQQDVSVARVGGVSDGIDKLTNTRMGLETSLVKSHLADAQLAIQSAHKLDSAKSIQLLSKEIVVKVVREEALNLLQGFLRTLGPQPNDMVQGIAKELGYGSICPLHSDEENGSRDASGGNGISDGRVFSTAICNNLQENRLLKPQPTTKSLTSIGNQGSPQSEAHQDCSCSQTRNPTSTALVQREKREPRLRWTEEENYKLRHAREVENMSFGQIANSVLKGRSAKACEKHYQEFRRVSQMA